MRCNAPNSNLDTCSTPKVPPKIWIWLEPYLFEWPPIQLRGWLIGLMHMLTLQH